MILAVLFGSPPSSAINSASLRHIHRTAITVNFLIATSWLNRKQSTTNRGHRGGYCHVLVARNKQLFILGIPKVIGAQLYQERSPMQAFLRRSVYIVYTVLGDVSIYVVGKVSEVIFVITSAVKDICGKALTERLFLDRYGRICLCLDEIVWKGYLENTDKDRIKRLVRLKPPTEF